MEAGETETYGQRMTALNELLKRVTDRRTIVEYTVAEKIQKTYRIESSSWKEAKEKMQDSDESLMDDYVDGSYEYVKEYAPQYERKIKQLKIGHQWYDLDDLECDPEYYLERVTRWD